MMNMKKIVVAGLLLFAGFAGYTQETSYAGTWTKKSYAINGKWSIVAENGNSKIVLDADFKTKSAPDLKIFLSTREIGDLKSDNATTEAILISPLKKSSGRQEYTINVLIHCEEYSVLWGVAELTQ